MPTRIEWADETWNPVAGCSQVSAGCARCYAMRLAPRLARMGASKYEGLTAVSGGRLRWTGQVALDTAALARPAKWRRPRRVFVNSMSDLFHEAIPRGFLDRVFEVMRACPRHVFQILTKRAARLRAMAPAIDWPPNAWMGVSVESAAALGRRDDLAAALGPAVRFLSAEPLLGPLRPDLAGIDWVIAGGETGPGARPMRPEWARELRDLCTGCGVLFFFKQWGGPPGRRGGRLLDGRTWDQFPEARQ